MRWTARSVVDRIWRRRSSGGTADDRAGLRPAKQTVCTSLLSMVFGACVTVIAMTPSAKAEIDQDLISFPGKIVTNDIEILPKDCPSGNGACHWSRDELTLPIRVEPPPDGGPPPTSYVEEATYSITFQPPEGNPITDQTAVPLIAQAAGPGVVVDGSAVPTVPLTLSCQVPPLPQAPLRVIVAVKAAVSQSGAPVDPIDDKYEFHLTCKPRPPEPKAVAQSNGRSDVEPSPFDQTVVTQFVVRNLSPDTADVRLSFTHDQTWALSTPPATMTLGSGEAASLYVSVVVPGGTPVGAVDEITLTAALSGIPDSSSSAAATVTVIPALGGVSVPALGRWGLLALIASIGAAAILVLVRRRA